MSRYSVGGPSLLEAVRKNRELRKTLGGAGAVPDQVKPNAGLLVARTHQPAVIARSHSKGAQPLRVFCSCGRPMRRCDDCGQHACDAPGHARHLCGGAA
ncbi:MAG: hypothetical protein QM723_07110 [Myxococcaceae bacterium]